MVTYQEMGLYRVVYLKKALSQFAFHSDDTSLFIAGLKSQAGNNKSVFENLMIV
jgi:hypothetical protein